jgi:outer membrane protein OmpA-like peptidoglycan-associated protein
MKKLIANNATGYAMPLMKAKNTTTILLMLIFTSLSFNGIAKDNAALKNNDLKQGISKQITITGTVKDNTETPVKDVQIKVDGKEVATTNNDGHFSFIIEEESYKSYQLAFIKEGYNNTIRNYSVSMSASNYSITMIKICKCVVTEKCFAKNIQFNFDNDADILNTRQKNEIDELIECLKANPEKTVTIQYNTLNPKKQIGPKRLDQVLHYFMLKGITSNRLKKEINSDKGAAINKLKIIPE